MNLMANLNTPLQSVAFVTTA